MLKTLKYQRNGMMWLRGRERGCSAFVVITWIVGDRCVTCAPGNFDDKNDKARHKCVEERNKPIREQAPNNRNIPPYAGLDADPGMVHLVYLWHTPQHSGRVLRNFTYILSLLCSK